MKLLLNAALGTSDEISAKLPGDAASRRHMFDGDDKFCFMFAPLLLDVGMNWFKVLAPCMYDYHAAMMAIHNGPHENGIIELSLEKSGTGTEIIVEFGCNLTIEQIKDCWGDSFATMAQTLALIPNYTGQLAASSEGI